MKSTVAVFVASGMSTMAAVRCGAMAKSSPKAANSTAAAASTNRGTGYFGAKRLNGTGASTLWPFASCTRAARRMLARP